MIEGMLWVEKYRPDTMEDLALSESNRSLLEAYIDAGEIPHLLLLGPPGCGKTTLARILLGQLECAVMTLNASNERGIDVIRDKVQTFARGSMGHDWNIVFLDEADALTRDAQTAMRNMMEAYSDGARFILTGNYGHKIIDALHSRCQLVELHQLEAADRFRVLASILDAEEIEYEPADALSYAKRYKDLRKMIMTAQRAILSNAGELVPASEMTLSGEDVWSAVELEQWSAVVEMSKHPSFDHRQALIDLFWAIPDKAPKVASLRAAVAKAVHESGYTPDPVVHFLGTCAELMS